MHPDTVLVWYIRSTPRAPGCNRHIREGLGWHFPAKNGIILLVTITEWGVVPSDIYLIIFSNELTFHGNVSTPSPKITTGNFHPTCFESGLLGSPSWFVVFSPSSNLQSPKTNIYRTLAGSLPKKEKISSSNPFRCLVLDEGNIARWFNSWPFDPRTLEVTFSPLRRVTWTHHPKKVTTWITRWTCFLSPAFCPGSPTFRPQHPSASRFPGCRFWGEPTWKKIRC